MQLISRHYFLALSILGIVCEFFVSFALLGQSQFYRLVFQDGLIPILFGIILQIAMGFWLDRISPIDKQPYFVNGLVKPMIIFFVGILSASIANFILNGFKNLIPNDLFNNLLTWFFRPLFLAAPFGLINCAAFGTICFYIHKIAMSR
jgi:hypothetical protein